ncbi:hypothetical protein Tco_1117040, partial [Tanacetum coccineum]
MCNESWGRSSFARYLIEVNLDADLVDVVTIGILSLSREGFTKETIRVEYEWRPLGFLVMFMTIALKRWYKLKAATSEPKNGATNVGNASKSSSMLKSVVTSSQK